MNHACPDRTDNTFGPAAQCGDTFDFTLLFEQSIFSIGPSALMIVFSCFRLMQLHNYSVKTRASAIQAAKIALTILLVALQVALVVVWSTFRAKHIRTALPSAALSLCSAFGVAILSWAEHRKTIRPSSLLAIFLLSSIVLNAVQVRTLYIRHLAPSVAAVLSANIGLQVVLLVLESRGKSLSIIPSYPRPSPEALAGLFNRLIFWWLRPLFIKGFRSVLTLDDMDPLEDGLNSRVLGERLHKSWKRCGSCGRYRLISSSALCLRWSLLRIILPRCFLIGFTYAQPFLIHRAISLFTEPITARNRDYGYGLIAATGLIYGGIAITTMQYKHRLFRTVTMFRGAVVSMIYAKTLTLRADEYDESAAVTLMSTDIDRIASSVELANELWARLIEIGIGVWLLERQLGWACIAPIIIVLVCFASELRIASYIGGTQGVWVQAIQRRISVTSSCLRSMRSVKMMGLVPRMTTMLQGLRVEELRLGKRFRWLIVWLNVVASTPQAAAPLITFAAFVIKGDIEHSKELSTIQAFTSLSIIYLVTEPATSLLSSLPVVAAAFGCFERINKFLSSTPLEDQRELIQSHVPLNVPNDQTVAEITMDGVALAEVKTTDLKRQAIGISLNGVSIRRSPSSPIVLHSINLTAVKGSAAAVIGPIGCGKSTLLKAILGELPYTAGSIQVSSLSMAYCSQSSWLPNTSIREAICRTPDVDLSWYQAVIHACILEEDIASLPHGDSSMIGSRGLTLSGGQKQRIALARALYSRREIVLLDDVFSSLDNTTEDLLTSRVFGKQGILSRWKPTVIMATHSTHNLSLFDNVVVLSKESGITQQGKLDTLDITTGPNLFIQKSSLIQDDNHATTPAISAILPTEGRLDDLSRRAGDLSVYAYYLKSIGIKYTMGAVAIIVVYTLSVNFPQIWLMWYSEGRYKAPGQFIGVYTLFVAVTAISQGFMIWQIMIKIVPKSGAHLHRLLLETVMRAPMSFFAKVDSGITLNRFSQDMTLVDAILPSEAFGTFKSAIQCLAQAALISLGSSYVGIMIIPCLIILYFIQMFYLRTSRQLRLLDLEAKSPLYTHFIETLEGLSTIRAFGWSSSFSEINHDHLENSQKPYYLMYCVQRWLSLVLDLLTGGVAVIVMALALSLRSTTSPGALGVSLTSVLAFTQSLQGMITSWTNMETSLGAIARTKTLEADTVPEGEASEVVSPPLMWPEKGLIELKGVTAKYDGGIVAVKDLTMTILPGQKIGICGRTGSGKSSLLYTILRVRDLSSGTIIIDNIDISTIPRNTLQARLIAIPQDPFIIAGTVRLNLDPDSIISDDELMISALQKVHLWDTIQSRGGLDADLNMQPLSKGETQLLALARAILRKHNADTGKIVLFDEATSNIDIETDRLMQKVIREEFKEYTVLTVAHRMETIRDSDKIAVLDQGQLLRFDTEERVLEMGDIGDETGHLGAGPSEGTPC